MKDRDLLKQDDAIGGAEVNLDDYVAAGEKITVNVTGVNGASLIMAKTTPIRFTLSAKYIKITYLFMACHERN